MDHDHNGVRNLSVYGGVFFVSLATLMLEVLLTRIFSVTMGHHFAFFAISVAMFGLTLGGIAVFVRSSWFDRQKTVYCMAWSSLVFGISSIVSSLAHMWYPFNPEVTLSGGLMLAFMYIFLSVPFFFSGVCICLAMTRYMKSVGKIYAADLLGAGAACLLVIGAIKHTDGPTTIFLSALVALAGSVCFGRNIESQILKRIIKWTFISIAIFSVIQTISVWREEPLVRLSRSKGQAANHPLQLYEKWSSHGRIQVFGNPNELVRPMAWGLSPTYANRLRPIVQLGLDIDNTAFTVLTGYNGDPKSLEHLRFDITNLAHYRYQKAKVFVIGAGGGRDLLAALAFDQESVVGVEVNQEIATAVLERFGDFTGHFDQDPRISYVVDEARSYLSRQKSVFDIIQISLIDTWAATAAGAYALTENAVYTVEAWEMFLNHLTPNGVLSVTRWFDPAAPEEPFRLTSLAAEALLASGVRKPRDHIFMALNRSSRANYSRPPTVTALISRNPYTETDLAQLTSICSSLGFPVFLTPTFSPEPRFANLASVDKREEVINNAYFDLSAPTDNRPFFFNMLKPSKVLFGTKEGMKRKGLNTQSVELLVVLLIVVVALTIFCIFGPLVWWTRRGALVGAGRMAIYFATIGFGFMFIEISQIQKLIILLGHPTYAISVVLTTLLLSSGIGSYLMNDRFSANRGSFSKFYGLILLVILVAYGLVVPYIVSILGSSSVSVRILYTVLILAPVGLLLGMALPLGMTLANTTNSELTPWFWGINGAASVCGSVLAVAISMEWGISTTFWLGVVCYGLATCILFGQSFRTNLETP